MLHRFDTTRQDDRPDPVSEILDGEHGTYFVCAIQRDVSIVENFCVGVFWRSIISDGKHRFRGVGMTPSESIANALQNADKARIAAQGRG